MTRARLRARVCVRLSQPALMCAHVLACVYLRVRLCECLDGRRFTGVAGSLSLGGEQLPVCHVRQQSDVHGTTGSERGATGTRRSLRCRWILLLLGTGY